MSVKILPADPGLDAMIVEVMKNARMQDYTPERLCDHQKIIDAKHFYWWAMDMKKEEFAASHLFSDDFSYTCFGPQSVTAEEQARRSKFVNETMSTSHMGHQPMVWFMSDTTARAIFQYEDHHVYTDDGTIVQSWAAYVDDFTKGDDGVWRMSALRLAYRKMDGRYRSAAIPENWKPASWETF